jgi:hypothetical protein
VERPPSSLGWRRRNWCPSAPGWPEKTRSRPRADSSTGPASQPIVGRQAASSLNH